VLLPPSKLAPPWMASEAESSSVTAKGPLYRRNTSGLHRRQDHWSELEYHEGLLCVRLFIVYKLIASDLDGTLLNSAHQVNDFTAETLQVLQDRGLQLVIATGRHFLDVAGIRAALGIRAHLITSNGARVHAPDDTLIHHRDVDPATARALTDRKFADGTLLNFYLDDEWLIDQPSERLGSMHKDSGFTYRITDLARHDGHGVAKVLYVAQHDHLLEVEAKLHACFGDTVTITFSAPNCLEVMAPGVTKGSALQMILDRLSIDAAHCLAFGDGQNDIELLQLAGHPRLMGNAHPRLAEQLPLARRIGSNEQSAVAAHLRELFGLN
jgi:Cof subfamily protein (haloacid dehalogenase superfamily)